MKKKHFILIIIIIGLIQSNFALSQSKVENYNNYSSLNLLISIESSILPKQEKEDMLLKYLTANLTLIPLDTESQFVQSLKVNSEPEADIEKHDNYIFFKWSKLEDIYKYGLSANVKTIYWFPKVYKKIQFPYEYNDPKLQRYLKATELIDVNDDIRNLTSSLVQGQTDYYEVVHMIAEWVEDNVKYNLTTLNEKSVFKASQVLQTKEGVCDEITNLFIAMLRSVGIPARFVVGQVYSNINYGFDNHGWAEVYFPGVGWLPFDVTFKQLGWSDPSHIQLEKLIDPSIASVTYGSASKGLKLYYNPLIIKTHVENTVGNNEKYAELSIKPLKDEVGPGSYVPIMVTVKNLENFYLPLFVHLTKSTEIIGNSYQNVLLEPSEEKNLFWVIKMPDNIKDGYMYTATIEAVSSSSMANSTKIKISEDYPVYDKDWANERINRLKPRGLKSYLPNIKIDCNFDKPYYYRDEQAKLVCSIKNKGNTNFKLIKFCLETDCHDAELKIGEQKDYEWTIDVKNVKYPELKVSAESSNMVKYTYPVLRIIEEPKIVVHEFRPTQVKYNTKNNFYFLLSSNPPVYNVTLKIEGYGSTNLGKLNEKHLYLIPFNSKDFRRGNVKVVFTYYDEVGKLYTQEQLFKINVTDLPWYIKFLAWIEDYLS